MNDRDPYRPSEAELMEMTREEFAAHRLEVDAITRSAAVSMIEACEDALAFRLTTDCQELKLSKLLELSLLSAYDEHAADDKLGARIEALIRAYNLQYAPGTDYHQLGCEILVAKGYDLRSDPDCLSDEEVGDLLTD